MTIPDRVNAVVTWIKTNTTTMLVCVIIALIITMLILYFTSKPEAYLPVVKTDTRLYEATIDSLKKEIRIKDESIKYLIAKKSIITTKYETKVKEYSNPVTISDDSVTGYISSRLQSRRD